MSDRRKILILSANPSGTVKLRLDEESREIKEGLRRSKQRDNYEIETAEAVRYRDIHRAILDYEPNIVHFCGHGAGEEGLVFEDDTGKEKLVSTEALSGLFELFADKVECVVLNACYSQVQAKAIAEHINDVIGMNQAIGDRAAIEFAVGFYDALCAGKGVEFAYKLGCNSIIRAGIPQHLIPEWFTKGNKGNIVNQPSPIEDEENCYRAIVKPGALIRIKAPEKMGKSQLLDQILNYSQEQNPDTVSTAYEKALSRRPKFRLETRRGCETIYHHHI